jgi:hypothetical protein
MAHRLEARARGAAFAASGTAFVLTFVLRGTAFAVRGAALAGVWIACTIWSASAAAADTATALLTQVTGNPTIVELTGGAPRNVSYAVAGRSYGLPLEIETGERDSATFALPNSVIEVSPNTLMRVVAPERTGGGVVQRVLQQGGSSLFRVHRGTIDRFQVETPFLVSVVKGTVFNVLVQDDGATVSLQEGRLEVDSVDARQSVILSPGDVAFAGRDGMLHLMQLQMTRNDAAPGASVAPTSASSPIEVRDAARVAGDSTTAEVDSTVNGSTSVVGPVAAPIVSRVEPTVATVTQPLVAMVDNVAPGVNSVVAPVVNTVVDTVATPLVTTVVTPVVDTIVAAPVMNTVTPVVAPLTNVVAPVTPVMTPAVAPIAPVVAPITTVTSTVTAPVAPVVNDVTAPLGGLLTNLHR